MAQSNDTLVREFVEAFNTKDADRLVPYLHPQVVFHAYGDQEVRGRDAVVEVWRGVFGTFAEVQFATVHQDWPQLVAAACETLQGRVAGPYALVGHSFGALLAYEVAATLPRTGPGPALLIVAGRNGPAAGLAHRPLHMLDDDRLIESLRRLGGTPAEVLAEPALMRLALPVLRTDLRLAETYARPPRPALPCPIAAVVGRHDRMADAAGSLAWQQETVDRFDLTVADAGHFLLDHPQVIATLTARMTELLRPGRRPEAGTTSG